MEKLLFNSENKFCSFKTLPAPLTPDLESTINLFVLIILFLRSGIKGIKIDVG